MFDVRCSPSLTFPIRFLLWPNVLALDAVLIALLWHGIFASVSGQKINGAAMSVLGLSIWLTYIADRLFDVAKRPMDQLHSIRHRFTKKHTTVLWRLWLGALVINVSIAFTSLTGHQLLNGSVLLMFCLLYTMLNQKWSNRLFPKELCVAIIYAAGVIVFLLPVRGLWAPTGFLMLLCLINCLIISDREQQIDVAMKTYSMAQLVPKLPFALYIFCLFALVPMEKQWLLPFVSSLAALMLVHFCRNKLSTESFRIFADASLLVGPLFALLFASA